MNRAGQVISSTSDVRLRLRGEDDTLMQKPDNLLSFWYEAFKQNTHHEI